MTEDEFTQTINQLDYGSMATRNREAFLLKYGRDFVRFEVLLKELQQIWLRVARERDSGGRSHVGLTLLSSILVRQCVFAFQQIISFQSFLAWLCFRPGLEGLLILGKWVDDPKTALVWRTHPQDKHAYSRLFSGKSLVSASLPESRRFRDVLTRLTDQFVHPNPYFAYRESSLRPASDKAVILSTRFFDDSDDLHEAHLLAFLHLLEIIVLSSDKLTSSILGSSREAHLNSPRELIEQQESTRSRSLADKNPLAKKILEELGLWNL
jgi:hypothetical protein